MDDQIVNVSFLASAISSFTVDATIKEAHQQDVEITENPIEFGAPVNDHQYLKPKTLDLEVVISDAPMGDIYDRQFGEKGSNRNGEAYKKFIELAKSGEPFDIQTRLLLYRNMLISSISTVTELASVGGQTFNISFREANLVYTEVVNYNKPKKPSAKVQAKASRKTTQGKVQGKDIAPTASTTTTQSTPPPKKVSIIKGAINGDAFAGVNKYFGG